MENYPWNQKKINKNEIAIALCWVDPKAEIKFIKKNGPNFHVDVGMLWILPCAIRTACLFHFFFFYFRFHKCKINTWGRRATEKMNHSYMFWGFVIFYRTQWANFFFFFFFLMFSSFAQTNDIYEKICMRLNSVELYKWVHGTLIQNWMFIWPMDSRKTLNQQKI